MTSASITSRCPSVQSKDATAPAPYQPASGFWFGGFVLAFPGAPNLIDHRREDNAVDVYVSAEDAESDAEPKNDGSNSERIHSEVRRCITIVFPADYEPDSDAQAKGEEALLVPMADGTMMLVAPIEPPLTLKVQRMFEHSIAAWMDSAMVAGALDCFTSLPEEKQSAFVEFAIMKRNQYRDLVDGKLPLPDPAPLGGRSQAVVKLVKKAGGK